MVKETQRSQSNRVWTPISNAFEAYRRRLIIDPTAFYEHTWRLIHIQESLVVTLGAALATRLFHFWTEQTDHDITELSSLQNRVTGIRNIDYDSNSNSASCLGGSIVAWINLLQRFSLSEIQPQCPFVNSLKEYLHATPNEKPNSALLEAWQSIGVVPTTAYDEKFTRIKRFEAINTLRNKLAHVPISGRILPKLHTGLRQEVVSLLTDDSKWLKLADDSTEDLRITSWYQPLCGRLVKEYAYVAGSEFGKLKDKDNLESNNKDVFWTWFNKDTSKDIKWQASPFVHIDDELKVSLLFRLHGLNDDLDEDLDGDYHRFAAEVEPVQKQKVFKKFIKDWIPLVVPVAAVELLRETADLGESSVTQQNLQAEQEDLTAYDLRSKAENAFHERDYRLAMNYFDKLADKNEPSEYNDVAKSKHGAAMWRTANRFFVDDKDKQIQLMNSAISLLEQASQHQDISYSARALYEKSKALWHLSEMMNDNMSIRYLKEATDAAKASTTVVYDFNYQNWLERLQEKSKSNVCLSFDKQNDDEL